TLASEPWNAPIGVRAAPTMTTSCTLLSAMASSGTGGSILTLPGCQGHVARTDILPLSCAPSMDHFAGDLPPEKLDVLLDQPGGPAVLVHGGAGTNPAHEPEPYP